MAAMECKTKCSEKSTFTSGTTIPCSPDPLYTLRPHAGEVIDVHYVPNSYLVSGTTSGRLGIWDISLKREIWFQECTNPILSVNSLSAHNNILSQLRNNVVKVWDFEKKCILSSINTDRAGFCKLAVLESSVESNLSSCCFAVSHCDYGKVNIYDCQTQTRVITLSADTPQDRGMCMCVYLYTEESSGTVYIVGGFEDGSIVAWDSRNSHKQLASIKVFSEPVMCIAMDGKNGGIVAGSATNEVVKLSLSVQEGLLKRLFTVEIKNPGVAAVSVRNDSKIFCTGGWDGRLRIFRWKNGQPLAVLNYHTSTVNSCLFIGTSPYSNFIVCGSKDERISVWKIY